MLTPQPVEPGVAPEERAGRPAADEPIPPPVLPLLPSRAELLSAVFRSTRAAWNPSVLAPLWLYFLGAWLVWERMGPSRPLRILAVLLAWPPAVLAIALFAWEFGRGERLGLIAGLSLVRSRLVSALGGPLLILGGASFLIALVIGGGLALAEIPVVGRVLSVCWMVFPGMLFGILGAGLLVVGVPALPLVLAAGAVEEPFPYEAATRGISYLRAKPSRFLAFLLTGLAGAAAGTVVFAVSTAVFLTVGYLAGAPGFGASDLGIAGRLDGLGGELGFLLGEFAWPLAGLLGLPVPNPGQSAAVLAGRAVTAFAGASALSALARTYLLLRWEVDGEPPGSQVRPGEEFGWTEE